MNRVNKTYYECEDGHITAGDDKKKKCDAELWQLQYTKGKRKGSGKGEKVKEEKPCGKPLIASGDIPEKLDYFSVWDYKVMHAFLIGQKFDAHFMVSLQEAFKELKDKLDEKSKS